jgi:chromate transporter
MTIASPVIASFDWRAALLAALAAVLIFRTRTNVLTVLAVSAMGGLALAA